MINHFDKDAGRGEIAGHVTPADPSRQLRPDLRRGRREVRPSSQSQIKKRKEVTLMTPIVEPEHEDERRRAHRISLAKKAIWLRELNRRKDASGKVSEADAHAAAVAAGLREPAPVPTSDEQVRIARLEAAVEHGLNPAQVEAMTGTTPEQIREQAAALAAPGDGGARTDQRPPVTGTDRNALSLAIAQAEKVGDSAEAWRLKTELLRTPADQ